jgi:hypothetical protein
LYIKIGPFDGRCVKEHQKNAGDGEEKKEETRDSSQTERIGESKAMALHLHWKDVEEKVVEHQHRSFEIRIGYSSSKNRAPNHRICDTSNDSLFHLPSSLKRVDPL